MYTNLADIDARQFRALTGLSHAAFDQLLPSFAEKYHQALQERYPPTTRPRKPGAGQKGKREPLEPKLFFCRYYLKTYPTFDVLGDRFGLDRSTAGTNVHRLCPILIGTLTQLGVLPKRQFGSVAELAAAFAEVEQRRMDATERPSGRPHDPEKQHEAYSGKKQAHPVKNTVIASTPRMCRLFWI
jgi:Helix-turn-helix of DDE superfamily endonuclease